MFKCQKCDKSIGPYISPIKLIIEKRNRTYEITDGPRAGETSEGWEIVKEMVVCPDCNNNVGT